MDTLDAIKQRLSANAFDSSAKLDDATIQLLASYALEAPASFNLQQTRLIAVTEKDAKEKLKAVAWNQQKIADAAVTFIVLGDLLGHEKHAELMQRAVAAKVIDSGTADWFVNGSKGFYGDYANAQLVRDEVIRSASLVSMTLMLAAEAMGYASGPMIGFDPAGVKQAFGIGERYLPVMLIAVGPAAPGNWPRKPRLTPAEALGFNHAHHFS